MVCGMLLRVGEGMIEEGGGSIGVGGKKRKGGREGVGVIEECGEDCETMNIKSG